MSEPTTPATHKPSQRKATATAAAGAAATVVIWLLSYFAPGLMETAPTGIEAAFTTLIASAAALLTKETTA